MLDKQIKENLAAQNALFAAEYAKLNAEQKHAVDTIDGPVMVIAGPGTGKTQVLALRIANILDKTDTQADGILCLTFTKSGVEAMRRRLRSYIGPDARKIDVQTFHAFGISLIKKYFHVLGMSRVPVTLEDHETVALFDYLLGEYEWQYIRPRGNSVFYYNDLRSLISLVRREGLSPQDLRDVVEGEIALLRTDPKSLSSRGQTKGEIKKDIQAKIESLERTKEAATFFEKYEQEKHERGVMDYDDILLYMTTIVRESEDARAFVREQYLYVLVDEHQDSSGAQNEFLKTVWGDVEQPNIFVVGDDRQLIYGFGGASLSYFQEFKQTFPGTKVITLIENYRSTQTILDVADNLLASELASGKLRSHYVAAAGSDGKGMGDDSSTDKQHAEQPIEMVVADYPRDEILQAGLFFREKIKTISPRECALLVPKNHQVRSAVTLLRDIGLPVSSTQSLRLFDAPEAETLSTILKIIHDPFDASALSALVLDPMSEIPPLTAHTYLHELNIKKFSIQDLLDRQSLSGLLVDPIGELGAKLQKVLTESQGKSIYSTIQEIGQTFFLATMHDHETFVRRVEVVRSFLHLALGFEQKNPRDKIARFLAYLERLRDYGEQVPLATFGMEESIQVMTLHGSKGLEFEAVWIAHLNERALMGTKRLNFTLPQALEDRIEKRNEAVAKRELYVAITRAKKFCTLSYARRSYTGGEEHVAAIIESLPDGSFNHSNAFTQTDVAKDPLLYVASRPESNQTTTRADLRKLVAEKYASIKVSVTLLNNFFDCPWKWYFRSFLRVPEPMSETLQFGSVVHGALERIVMSNTVPNAADVQAVIAEEIARCHIIDTATIKRFTNAAVRAVSRFIENEYRELWEDRESEKSMSYKDPTLPDLTITGKIDLMESDGGETVRVTDFKTGKPKSARELEKIDDEGRMHDYMRQLAMYSYLIQAGHKGRYQVGASRLYFIEETKPDKAVYETAVTDEQIDLLKKDMHDYDVLMKNGEWTERACHWKGFGGAETECPYCKMAKMYK